MRYWGIAVFWEEENQASAMNPLSSGSGALVQGRESVKRNQHLSSQITNIIYRDNQHFSTPLLSEYQAETGQFRKK